MITLSQLICRWFDLVPRDYWEISQANVEILHNIRSNELKSLRLQLDVAQSKLEEASQINGELQIKLKQVTFLENRVKELEIELSKRPAETPKSKLEPEIVITGRGGWRAVAQMRSMQTIPGPDNDSVAALEHKAAKESDV